MARAASLENALALHCLICVDGPSSFGDISVASLGNILRLSATGSSRSFLTCQCLVRVYVQFARSTCHAGNVLTTAILTRDAAKVCCSTYLRLASVGVAKMSCLPKEVLSVPRFFSFFC